MSTLVNGTEDLVGQNLTPAAAYAVVNTAFQKMATMQWHRDKIDFFGLVKDGQKRGGAFFPTDATLVNVQIVAEGDAPSGSALTLQVVVAGTTIAQVFSLNAGSANSGQLLPSSPIYVNAGQTVAVLIGAGSQASDVAVYLTWQKVTQ